MGQLIAALHMGDLDEETAPENTYLFGTTVIPLLRICGPASRTTGRTR